MSVMDEMPRNVVFWGATGQAKALRECVRLLDMTLVALFENNRDVVSPFPDVPLFYGDEALQQWVKDGRSKYGFFAAIGGEHGKDRVDLHDRAEALGLISATAVHPTAFVAVDAVIRPGTQIMARASVCVEAVIGRCCLINTAASVDHECVLGEGVHIGPGATLAGCVEVGNFATIYTGAVVTPRVKIGTGAIIGAGAIVRHDVPAHAVMVGNPARVLRSRNAR